MIITKKLNRFAVALGGFLIFLGIMALGVFIIVFFGFIDIDIHIIEELQDGAKAEAAVKAKAIDAGIKDATFENALRKLKAQNAVSARQDPTKQVRHNTLELTPLELTPDGND